MGAGASTSRDKDAVCRSDFIFSSPIGVGGFSSVKSTMHVPSKTWMALKETNIQEVCTHKKGLSMLASEVQILAHLSMQKQPYIVNMHFAFRDNQKCYMALDLHPGGDLRHHIRKRKAFPEKIVAFYAICLSSALHFLHGKGILHRDIKPENVILDSLGFPYLTDFGVSTMSSTDRELSCESSSGTRQYLAPEVFTKNHRHGVEADFWSLGVMLYELVYGRRPFQKHCPHEMILFHEDMRNMNITLSSTSLRFEQKDLVAQAPLDALAGLGDSSNADDAAMASMTNDQSSEEIEHWLHVATSIKESSSLAQKMDDLRRSATQDLLLEEKSRLLSKFSIKRTKKAAPFHSARLNLPSYLRVSMPKYSANSKRVSTSCVAVLEGLLDVRRWSRMGAGNNYNTLRRHTWFEDCKLRWDLVENKQVVPAYAPNIAKVTRELAFKHEQNVRKKVVEKTELVTTATGEKRFQQITSSLPSSDLNILEHFYFVAPQHCTADCQLESGAEEDKASYTRSTVTDIASSAVSEQ